MLTVGETLRGEIERYAQALVRSNDLFLAAQNGALTADDVRLYVRGLLFLIQGTMRVLHRAAERASDAGRGALADHYLRKIREERGHDQWAERDLDSLPGAATASTQGEEQPALRDLLRYLDQVVDRDPSLLLSYILVAEYLTVLVGPAWLVRSRAGAASSSARSPSSPTMSSSIASTRSRASARSTRWSAPTSATRCSRWRARACAISSGS